MLMAMAGAGFALADSTLGSEGAVYWGITLVLVLVCFYAIAQIFTRVQHL
jgi:hypothetical protein